MKHEHWTKRWNWSGCTKLALRGSWTHGQMAQSVRTCEQNSVVVGSSPTQANFLQLLLKILQWWITYIYIYQETLLALLLYLVLFIPCILMYKQYLNCVFLWGILCQLHVVELDQSSFNKKSFSISWEW